jgi:hypothetical protein
LPALSAPSNLAARGVTSAAHPREQLVDVRGDERQADVAGLAALEHAEHDA